MVFLMVCWIFLTLLPRKRLIKNHAVCCNFSRITRVNLDELSFIVQLFNYFVGQRLLMGCRSYVTSFAESRFQIIAEGFVCFCKKRVSDNGKRLIQRWTSQVQIKGCPNSGVRFFYCKMFRLAFLPTNKTFAGTC